MCTTSLSGRMGTGVLRPMLAISVAALLAACAAGPQPTGVSPGRDGPPAKPPAGLMQVPDAQPQVEPLRTGGPNKPYEVLGRSYTPFTHDRPFVQRGLASWYGAKFHGRRTASGERYDMYAMTAAHPTMPLPSYARVRNPANGREVVVRVNDRGPFHPGRIIDLSYTAALRLDLLRGVAPVEVERITHEAIRNGNWRRDGSPKAGAPTPAQAPEPSATTVPDASTDQPGVPPPVAPVQAMAGAPGPGATLATTSKGTPASRDEVPPAGYWIQLGAFRQRDGAEDFQRRVVAELEWLGERLAVFSDASLFRLQAGPYPNRDEANDTAARIRSELQLVPVVLERR